MFLFSRCFLWTDSQAAAGQAAGPGSARRRGLSKPDPGDQAQVRAAPTIPLCPPSGPAVIRVSDSPESHVKVVLLFSCHQKELVNKLSVFSPESSRTKRIWVRSCKTLSLIQKSVIDSWAPPPNTLHPLIFSFLLITSVSTHLTAAVWPHPPGGPSSLCFYMQSCVCVVTLIQENTKDFLFTLR